MSDKKSLFASDPVETANENRRYAVRTAIELLQSGGAFVDPALRDLHFEMALDVLIKSVQKCSLLDNRPLDPDRVHTRHLATLAMLYAEAPGEVA
jgi:hypothetical protein